MNYTDLISAVKLMGQGMLAIFVVMAVVSVVVYLANTLIRKGETDA